MDLAVGMKVSIVSDGAPLTGVITGTKVSVFTNLDKHEFRIAVRPDNGGKVVIVRRQNVKVLS